MRTKELFKELAPDYSPKYDPWGHAMGAYFAVASVLYFDYSIVEEGNFRPGAAQGPDEDDYSTKALLDLNPITGRIERAGLSY